MIQKIDWPEGKDFAFTIFDDPDGDSVETLEVVYSFLRDLGLARRRRSGLSEETTYLRWVGPRVKTSAILSRSLV